MDQARTLLTNVTLRGRLGLAASALGVLVVGLLLFRLASAPSYTLLTTGLDPAQAGKVTAALDQKGIRYELRNNGTALAVDKARTAQARVALAEQGLPGTTGPGFELFDKQKLGTSDFQQKVTYQRALEGEIARTIGQIQGVAGAQVRLALPTQDVFAETQRPPTAAVLLAGSADGLDAASVRGIARLVASSVEGLKPSNVTIADGAGQLLWPAAGAGDGGAAASATAKQAAEARYAQQLQGRLDALLEQTVGPGKAQVEATVDLDVDQTSREQLTYAKKGTPLRTQTETETLRGTGAKGAASGSAANIPSYAQGAGGASNNYKRKSATTEFGVDKLVTHTQVAPGQVKKLSVALLVDKSVAPAQFAALKQAVAGAAGITPARGDQLTAQQVVFAKPVAPKATGGPVPPAVVGPAKLVGLGLAVLVFLFFVRRHLRRREEEELAEPVWLREISAQRTLAELESAYTGNGGGNGQPAGQPESPRRKVEQIVTREPAAVANQVRIWMQE